MSRRPRRDEPDLVHPIYRHLDRPVRVAGLALRQWGALVAAGLTAYALAKLLPLPPATSAPVAVTLCGVPVAAQLAAGDRGGDVFSDLLALAPARRSATRPGPRSGRRVDTGSRPAAPRRRGETVAESNEGAATGTA